MRALADVHAVNLGKSPALTMAKPKLFQFNNAAPGSGTTSPGIATVMVPWRVYGVPLLGVGLGVGWVRAYLGVHFPLDIVGALQVALQVALIGAVTVYSLKGCLLPVFAEVLHLSMMGSKTGNFRHRPG